MFEGLRPPADSPDGVPEYVKSLFCVLFSVYRAIDGEFRPEERTREQTYRADRGSVFRSR